MRAVGSAGTGNGQLKNPRGIVFIERNLYVTDMGNNRVRSSPRKVRTSLSSEQLAQETDSSLRPIGIT